MESNIRVNLHRVIGNQDNDWAIGYQGDFYEATVTSQDESMTLGWSFKGETIETNVVAMGTENRKKYVNFYVTFNMKNDDVINTRMVLLRPLVEGESGEKVEFYTISGYPVNRPRKDFEKTIIVRRK